MKAESSDFKTVADSVFETLLTITTILSGVYIATVFDWFKQVIGTQPTPETLERATVGIILGLLFILPLVFILLAWAFSKFRGSITWRTVAWSGLIYCLTQDFIGLVALFGFSLIMAGVLYHELTVMVLPFVLLIPPILGIILGYRVSIGYSRSLTVGIRRGKLAFTAFLTVIFILVIQVLFGLIAVYFGEIL